jgi:hypothetical protein
MNRDSAHPTGWLVEIIERVHKRLGTNWDGMCEKLPKRFEGEYRNSTRNGVFVYRNGSVKPQARRYQDGERVT